MKFWKTQHGKKTPYNKLTNVHLMSILNGGFAEEDEFHDLLELAESRGLNTDNACQGELNSIDEW